MKGMTRPRQHLSGLAFLCLLGLRVMSLHSVEAQEANITTAQQLLALKEAELIRFVSAVEANARNCDALNGCNSSSCSRLSCYKYGTPGFKDYSCLGVVNNSLCSVPGNATCIERNHDFTEGYIRRVDLVDVHNARTVCTHRTLDDHFKNSTTTDPRRFFRVFVGAVDGTFRIYPGADELCEEMYDPRIRPWYLESIYIPKVVTVLIDSGLNMRDTISGSDGETYISKAIDTALRFLDTLKEDYDYVTLACFDGDGVKQLGVTAKYNKAKLDQSFIDSLAAVVGNGSTSNPDSTLTNDAILNATSQLTRLTASNSIPASYLKVVIALVGGQQYQGIADMNASAIPNDVNLFVYSFRTRQDSQCDPATRASLEDVPDERLSNPLFVLQSYFSFLAKLHNSYMKNQTDYGPQFKDFSGIDNSTLTISKGAFGPNGEFLGVVGINFFENFLQEGFPTIQFGDVVSMAGTRNPGREFDASKDVTQNICFNRTDACPALASPNVQGFLCAEAKSPDVNIGCCGSCKGTSVSSGKHIDLGLAIGGGAGGFVALCLVICTLVFWHRIRRDRRQRNRDYPDFEGPQDYPDFDGPRTTGDHGQVSETELSRRKGNDQN